MTRVLIVGIDGLQPAQVTKELMPNLTAFAASGVSCQNHHAVFPTVTRANVVSMLTGRHPGGHGLTANTLVVPEFAPDRAIPAMEPELTEVIAKMGRVLLAPNLADILGGSGREFISIGIGTSGNSFLQNPNAETVGGATVHTDFSLPRGLYDEIVARFGPWPEKKRPDEKRLAHAVRIMTEYVISERDPEVALFWCSEPDSSHHYAGVGSDLGNRSLAAADRHLGQLLEWLDKTGRAPDTDVMVVSDHGYSTIKETVDVQALLRAEGFQDGDRREGVIVASNGGAVLFYVRDHDSATAERLVDWLMAQEWCGPVVASSALGGIEGILPASLVGLEGQRAPDLAMSLAWDSEPNVAGYAGRVYGKGEPGLGTHGSMSRHEMRNVLIARGPSFKSGVDLDTPTGSIDVAPTVLSILGLDGGESIEGRVLIEAMLGGPSSADWTTKVLDAERRVAGGLYRQRITVSGVGDTTYVDEGSARLEP